MRKNNQIYGFPNMGCLIGTAYQTLLSRLNESLANHNIPLSASEYMILRALYTNNGIQQCDIAEMLGKDKSAVCRSILAMEKKGLVRMEPVSHKCRRIFLSEHGEELKPKIMKIASERQNELSEILTDEEITKLNTILHKIITN